MVQRVGGSRTSRTGRGGHSGLSDTAIVDCALALSQREGAEALTLRRIGAELGVDSTAFYRHFRDKNALILACTDQVLDIAFDEWERDVDQAEEPVDWRRVLWLGAQSIFRNAHTYAAIFGEGFARITGGPGERKWVERMLATMHDEGLSANLAVAHYRAFIDTVLGLSGMWARIAALPPELALRDGAAWTTIYARLPNETFPATRAHAQELQMISPTAVFDRAVTAILDDIAVSLSNHGPRA